MLFISLIKFGFCWNRSQLAFSPSQVERIQTLLRDTSFSQGHLKPRIYLLADRGRLREARKKRTPEDDQGNRSRNPGAVETKPPTKQE